MEPNKIELQKIVESIITTLSKEVVSFDKKVKTTFDLMAECCKFREQPEHYKLGCKRGFLCKNPDLEDPQFGWACDIGDCPYMNKAMDWRANNL